MKKSEILLLALLYANLLPGQSYTSYFTGNATDTVTCPGGGICLMGGATESDEAMKWFLQRANGGDILVLRASGSNGYNDYLYSELGITVNSVETIVFHNLNASFEPYIHDRINHAEAIWFAGGDQWDYVSYWRDTPVDSLVNLGISHRKIVMGGTSAGMAVQGSIYFTAQNGTVTSSTALSNPYNSKVAIDSAGFIKNRFLTNVITDTHYDNPDRRGRHVTFLARALTDYSVKARGIACDEYTAVCIDTNGMASVYGHYPPDNDNAYFIQTNCELSDVTPEKCSSGSPLNWNLGGHALKVYKAKGTVHGSNTFDLKDWKTGSGGAWEDWHVENGVLYTNPGEPLNCATGFGSEPDDQDIMKIFPNPASDYITIETNFVVEACQLIDSKGTVVRESVFPGKVMNMDLTRFRTGVYLLKLLSEGSNVTRKIMKY